MKIKFKPLSRILYLSFSLIPSHKQSKGSATNTNPCTSSTEWNYELVELWTINSSSLNPKTFRTNLGSVPPWRRTTEMRNEISMPINMLTPNTWYILHGRTRTCMPTTSLIFWCASDPITTSISGFSFSTKLDFSPVLSTSISIFRQNNFFLVWRGLWKTHV